MIDTEGKTSEKIRLYAYLNAIFQQGFTNPIDQAISSLHLSVDNYEKINEIPYDFIRKRLSVAVKSESDCFFITKGALSNVLDVCSYLEATGNTKVQLNDETRNDITGQFELYSKQGYRVLGLAAKEMTSDKINRTDEIDMTFLGFILLEDPLKESTIASIERLEHLNIAIKIITGDNRFAAYHAAQKIGIKEPCIITGDELNNLSPEALAVQVMKTTIFAEIEPYQKERIIRAVQESHQTVAYMGDGINDVAAIHAADIGISTNNATDVAKEAADFVLLDKDLSVLADGITEGRKSFANSMKYIFITTGATFGNMFSMAGASLLLPFLPMLPKQILLTNLITDFPFLTIASDGVEEDQLTQPLKWNLKLIQHFMIVFGLHSSLFDFITFYLLYHYFQLSGPAFQTGWFLESAITEVLILFVVRTHKPLFRSRPGKWLLIIGCIAMAITAYLPLSPFAGLLGFSIAHFGQVMTIVLILMVYVVTADWLKIVFFKWNEKQQGNQELLIQRTMRYG